MKRHISITFSTIFLLMAFFPCQVLAASITETKAAIGVGCTASGDYSTAMGFNSTSSGDFSWVGGRYMQLAPTADHTFVWGSSDSPKLISAPNAFLIFPAGTSGKVGIGTKSPNEVLEVAVDGRAFFGDGGGSSRKGLLY
jgi:hypothetical protein